MSSKGVPGRGIGRGHRVPSRLTNEVNVDEKNKKLTGSGADSIDSKRKDIKKESLFQLGAPKTFELPKPKSTLPNAAPRADTRANFIQQSITEKPFVQPRNPIRNMLHPSEQGDGAEQPNRRTSTGDISGHEARAELLSTLVNEKDAIAYFLSKQTHKHQVKFLHLLPADTGYRAYLPYEMTVVSEDAAEAAPFHYVMTDTAVTVITKEVDVRTGGITREVEALTLADWIHERDSFHMLRKRYTLFGMFHEMRAMYHWKCGVRAQQFYRTRQRMSESLCWKDSWLTTSFMVVREYAHKISQLPIIDYEMVMTETAVGQRPTPLQIEHFKDKQSPILDEAYKVISSAVNSIDNTIKESLSSFQVKLTASNSTSIAAMRQEADEIAHRSKYKASLEKSIPVLTLTSNRIIDEALFTCLRKNIQGFLNSVLEKHLHVGMFAVSLEFQGGVDPEFTFIPCFSQLKDTILSIINMASSFLGGFASSSTSFHDMLACDVQIQANIQDICSELEKCFEEARRGVCITYGPAHAAWREVQRWDKSALSENPTLSALSGATDYWCAQCEVASNLRSGDTYGCLHINSSSLKHVLLPQVEAVLQSVKDVNIVTARHRTKRQLARYRARAARLQMRPNDLATFVTLLECLKTIENGMPSLDEHKREVDGLYVSLKADGMLAHDDLIRLRDVERRASEFEEDIQSCRSFCDLYIVSMKRRLLKQYQVIDDEISALTTELKDQGTFEDTAKYDHAASVMSVLLSLHRRLSKLGNEALCCRRQANVLSVEGFDMTALNECQALYDDIFTLWGMICEFEAKRMKWSQEPLDRFDADEISRDVHVYEAEGQRLHQRFNHGVSKRFSDATREFKSLLPLIIEVCNPAVTSEHRDELSELLSRRLEDRTGHRKMLRGAHINLMSLISLEVTENLDVVDAVVSQAVSMRLVESTVLSIQEIWCGGDALVFTCSLLENRIVGVDNIEQLIETCEDNILTLNVAAAHESQLGSTWLKRLIILQETLSSLRQLQELVLDIGESDKEWESIMEGINHDAVIKTALKNIPGRSHRASMTKLKQINDTSLLPTGSSEDTCDSLMQQCVSLTERLETGLSNTRSAVNKMLDDIPRLGLLPLKHLMNVNSLQVFSLDQTIEFLFEGVRKVNTLNDVMIELIGVSGEVVELGSDSIPCFEKATRLSVGKLVQSLETSIGRVLRRQTKRSLRDRSQLILSSNLEDEEARHIAQTYLLSYPAPTLMVVEDIRWNNQVSLALGDVDVNIALQDVLEMGEELRCYLIQQLVQQHTTFKSQHRLLFGSMIMAQFHRSDIVKDICTCHTNGISTYEWQRTLRFNWDKVREVVSYSCGGCNGSMGGEYYGAAERLVITPLTDRALLSIHHSLRSAHGVQMMGRGRRDTIHSLAATLGILCVEVWLEEHMSLRWLRAVVELGGWALMRGTIEGLRQPLNSFQIAVNAALPTVDLSGTPTTIKYTPEYEPLCGLFYFPESQHAVPSQLNTFFRPLAVVTPNREALCCMLLEAHGLNADLGKSLSEVLYQSAHLCTPAPNTFSRLTCFKVILRIVAKASEHMINTSTQEAQALSEALSREVRPALPSYLSAEFEMLLRTTFGVGNIDAQNQFSAAGQRLLEEQEPIRLGFIRSNLVPTSYGLTKGLELWEVMSQRRACLLIGGAGHGKSSVVQAVAEAYNVTRHPPFYLNATRYDLCIEDTLLKICQHGHVSAQQWVGVDGDLVDVPAVFSLLHGKIPPTARMIMEATDLRGATPTLIASCGVMFVECSDVGIDLVESLLKVSIVGCKLKALIQNHLVRVANFCQGLSASASPLVLISRTLKLLESDLLEAARRDEGSDGIALCGFIYCITWGCAGHLCEARVGFSNWIRINLAQESSAVSNSSLNMMHIMEDPFSFALSNETGLAIPWPSGGVTKCTDVFICSSRNSGDLIVPTISFNRFHRVVGWLMEEGLPTCVIGQSGVGKSIMMEKTIADMEATGGWYTLTSAMKLNSTARCLYQSMLNLSSLTHQRVNLLSLNSKRLAWFIDDMHLPQEIQSKDGDLREGVRQILDAGGFHSGNGWMQVNDVVITASIHAHRRKLDPRLMRHLILLRADMPSDAELTAIFRAHVSEQVSTACTSCAVDLFVSLRSTIKASPAKPQYALCCHDLDNLARRLYCMDSRLFAYECCRVFGDRLDRSTMNIFQQLLSETLKKHKLFSTDPMALIAAQVEKSFQIVEDTLIVSQQLKSTMPAITLFDKVVVYALRVARALQVGHGLMLANQHSGRRTIVRIAASLLNLSFLFEHQHRHRKATFPPNSLVMMEFTAESHDMEVFTALQGHLVESSNRFLVCVPPDGLLIRKLFRHCPALQRSTVMTLEAHEQEELKDMVTSVLPNAPVITSTLLQMFTVVQLECKDRCVVASDLLQAAVTYKLLMDQSVKKDTYCKALNTLIELPRLANQLQTQHEDAVKAAVEERSKETDTSLEEAELETSRIQVKLARCQQLLAHIDQQLHNAASQRLWDWQTIQGDTLVASAVLCFLGPIEPTGRDRVIHKWARILDSAGVPVRKTLWTTPATCLVRSPQCFIPFSMQHSDGDAEASVKIVHNLLHGRKIPLLVDPDGIAFDWLKSDKCVNRNPPIFESVHADSLQQSISYAVESGQFLVVYDIGDVLPPCLVGVLESFSSRMVEVPYMLNDVEIHPDFLCVLLTPYNSPPVINHSMISSVVSFKASTASVSDILFTNLLLVRDAKQIKNLTTAGNLINTSRQELLNLEEDVLLMLSSEQILSLDEVVDSEAELLKSYVRASVQAHESENKRPSIPSDISALSKLSSRGALFFSAWAHALPMLHPLYATPLSVFAKRIFVPVMQNKDIHTVDELSREILRVTSYQISMTDLSMAALVAAAAVLDEEGKLPSDEWLSMVNGLNHTEDQTLNSMAPPAWMHSTLFSGDAIMKLHSLESMKCFEGLCESMLNDSEGWDRWATSIIPENVILDETLLPIEWRKLSPLQRLLLIHCCRPDRLPWASDLFSALILFDDASSPLFQETNLVRQLEFAVGLSSPSSPILIILPDDTDCEEVRFVLDKLRISIVSAGDIETCKKAKVQGDQVYIEFSKDLFILWQQLESITAHPDFRIMVSIHSELPSALPLPLWYGVRVFADRSLDVSDLVDSSHASDLLHRLGNAYLSKAVPFTQLAKVIGTSFSPSALPYSQDLTKEMFLGFTTDKYLRGHLEAIMDGKHTRPQQEHGQDHGLTPQQRSAKFMNALQRKVPGNLSSDLKDQIEELLDTIKPLDEFKLQHNEDGLHWFRQHEVNQLRQVICDVRRSLHSLHALGDGVGSEEDEQNIHSIEIGMVPTRWLFREKECSMKDWLDKHQWRVGQVLSWRTGESQAYWLPGLFYLDILKDSIHDISLSKPRVLRMDNYMDTIF